MASRVRCSAAPTSVTAELRETNALVLTRAHARLQLSRTVTKYGAEVLEPDEDGCILVAQATHIVSHSIDFEQFSEAQALMVPVVRPDWISASISRNRQVQVRPYSPDPRMIFAAVNLTCADIPARDKEAILGATMALGGMESKDLTPPHHAHLRPVAGPSQVPRLPGRRTSSASSSCPTGSTTASSWERRSTSAPTYCRIPRSSARNPKTPSNRLRPSIWRELLQTRPQTLPGGGSESPRGALTVFRGKSVMLSEDLSIGKRFRNIVANLITQGDGLVVDDVDDCDMFICQYREGPQYVRAAQCGKDVGNLAWLFYLITHDEWCSPLRRLLHYPVPKDGIPGFKDMRITLSNYGGEARMYLENLITAAGATFTKTMKTDNTHLVTARGNSEKCEAAKDWNISMVNHLWVEESYAKCEAQSLANPKYITFPPRTNLAEVIGQTFFDEGRLRSTYYPGGEENMDAPAARKKKIFEAAQANTYAIGPSPRVAIGCQEHQPLEVSRDDKNAGRARKPARVPKPTRVIKNFATPARGTACGGRPGERDPRR